MKQKSFRSKLAPMDIIIMLLPITFFLLTSSLIWFLLEALINEVLTNDNFFSIWVYSGLVIFFLIWLVKTMIVSALKDKSKYTLLEDGLSISGILIDKNGNKTTTDMKILYKDILNIYESGERKKELKVINIHYWSGNATKGVCFVSPKRKKEKTLIDLLRNATKDNTFEHIIDPKYVSYGNISVDVNDLGFIDYFQDNEYAMFALHECDGKIILYCSCWLYSKHKIAQAIPPMATTEYFISSSFISVYITEYQTIDEAINDVEWHQEPPNYEIRKIEEIANKHNDEWHIGSFM